MPLSKNNSLMQSSSSLDILHYDTLLSNEEAVFDAMHQQPPRCIEVEHIEQGDIGLLGVTGSKAKTLFIVIGRADEPCMFWTREHRKDGCRTFKRKLTYERKGLRDSLYVIGFVGSIKNTEEFTL